MADPAYKDYPFIFSSKGIVARKVDDTVSTEEFLNLENCEELAENALSPRLGSKIINQFTVAGITTLYPLGGSVVGLAKLAGLNGSAWRYAVDSSGKLWRRGLGSGAYAQIASGLSGGQVSTSVWCPDEVSTPYLYLADLNAMLKDNGSLSAPQGMGIFQPRYPVLATVQQPTVLVLDNYSGGSGSYGYSGITGGTIVNPVSTTVTGVPFGFGPATETVSVVNVSNISRFQLLNIDTGTGAAETVLVLAVTSTGFTANFTKAHGSAATVTSLGLSVSVPASTKAVVVKGFTGKPISTWPSTLSLSDYISLRIYTSDPTNIQSITLKFDCGDGSFTSDFFYKVLAQGPLAELVSLSTSSVTDPTTAATDVLLTESMGLFNNSATGIAALTYGTNVWTPLLQQLSDFAGAGRADFNDPTYNWSNVNGYEVQIITNDGASVNVQLSGLVLFGGAGPDTLGGVLYDYLFTFFNINDFTESNPCMLMTNTNPPNQTGWVNPRRMPVLLNLTWGTATVPFTIDPQATHLRIYRRGGILGDNFRRLDQVPITGGNFGQTYLDTVSDANLASADLISFTNDVPVTSSLPVPVNTTLSNALIPTIIASATLVTVASTANMSIGQLATIGNPTALANNFETVAVLAVASNTTFYAFIQNSHAIGESVQATAQYGTPVSGMIQAYGQMYYWGDPNNPHYLYYSAGNAPQAVGSASYIEVGTPDDPITVVDKIGGNLYVSTRKFWWAIAPGTNSSGKPTVYPTKAKHGCVAPQGYVATDKGFFYQAVDGIRFFSGGSGEYLTQNLEFIFQGIGTTPIPLASPTQLASTVMAYWNNMIFVSYPSSNAVNKRLIFHTIYQRWRNDDQDAQSMLLEVDTNTLLFGDSNGYIHADRQSFAYDQAVNAGVFSLNPIAMTVQSGYNNQGSPEVQKNYQELTLDVNTNGQNLTATLMFDDGQVTQTIGVVNTSQRQKVNLNLNNGLGFTYYKASLVLTAAWSLQGYIYQASIKALAMAKTRKSMDTFWLRQGCDGNKLAKDSFWEFTSTAGITVNVYYDGSSTAFFTFTLPSSGGVRNSVRQRLPAVSYKMIRLVATSTADFQVWGDESAIECKPIATGKGYEKMPFVPN